MGGLSMKGTIYEGGYLRGGLSMGGGLSMRGTIYEGDYL